MPERITTREQDDVLERRFSRDPFRHGSDVEEPKENTEFRDQADQVVVQQRMKDTRKSPNQKPRRDNYSAAFVAKLSKPNKSYMVYRYIYLVITA